MRLKKCMCLVLSAAMVTSMFAGCGKEETVSKGGDVKKSSVEAEGYEYGEGKTFHSDEPVTYSMFYSDHENYPYKEDWLLWKEIEKRANVKFDLNIVARTDYNDKVSTLVNTGEAPFIIPKTYDDSQYVASGQVVPISDYVQYMPNYQKCIKDWGMEKDLKTIMHEDGKYYKLPGMWENVAGGYTILLRKDKFDEAGVDIKELEKTWTWEDFYEACKKVKQKTGCQYVLTEMWKGDSILSISANSYGVTAGWSAANGCTFNADKEQFEFADTSDNYKAYLELWSKMFKEGLVDPEMASEESDTANSKFYTGKCYACGINYQTYADMVANKKVQDKGAELYMAVAPKGPAGNYRTENSRLENGIMISKNALDKLGEKDFIKMLRFIDWLWYSDEGQTLCSWGVEGQTYSKSSDGKITLNKDIYYNGFNTGAKKQLNVDYGFAGGVFAYGGSAKLRESKMSEGELDWNTRSSKYREIKALDPPILATEDQNEDLQLIQTPLMDYVKTMLLSFATGKKDVESGWAEYVSQCESKGSKKYVETINKIYQDTKDKIK